MNVADYLLARAEENRVALVTRDAQYTYAELKQASARLLDALRIAGVHPADRVGLLAENSLFWVACYLAILKLGAKVVPFPTVSTTEDLNAKISFVQPAAVCVDARSRRRFSGVFDGSQALILEETLSAPGPDEWDELPDDFDDRQEAALMLTSGTTSRPRAVRVTHRNIRANTYSIVQYLELTEDDRMLVVLPFYYCFGTSLLNSHLRAGGSLVLCNTFAYPETALDLIERTGCTGFAGVPSTYQTLLRNTSFPKRSFKSLRKVQQAGGKLQPVFLKELAAALPEARIYVMYGQTEATARLSYLPPELFDARMGSIGRGIPGVELRVLDETGEQVKPGEVGEIVAWGENISPGYFNDPQATVEKFVDGGLRSGDLATVDEDGFIYIVDRKSDFIKSLGHRISSQEIESHILEMAEVVSAAAVGIPDLIQGEAIKVFVVLRQGSRLCQADILNYCRGSMVRHMVPKEVVIVESLPTSANGKVLKSLLRNYVRG